MLKPDGCIIIDGKESADTITCGHCGNVVIVAQTGDINFASCRMCKTFICLACEKLGGCHPFEKKLHEMEKKTIRDNQLRRLGF
jgi:hypothetical protein